MNHQAVTIVGSYLSPCVRKVLVCLAIKRLDYELDPIAALIEGDVSRPAFPIDPAPVFRDDNVTISDSTVICEYLEERYPTPAFYPATPEDRARARWLAEYADTRMREVFIRRLFNERVLRGVMLGEQANEEVVSNALDIQTPQVLDYLEHEFSRHHPFLFGQLGITEATIASYIRNAMYAGFTIDAQRWPVMHSVVHHSLQHPAFLALQQYEQISLGTPLVELREALLAAGAPVTSATGVQFVPKRAVLL